MILSCKLNSLTQVLPILEKIHQTGKPLFIIANDYDPEAIQALIANVSKGLLQICAVRSPFYGEKRNQILNDLAAAFRVKAKKIAEKYIMPPKTTDFAIVYVPVEGLYAELSSYRDPKTKELLLEELRKKHKVTIAGPNTLSAILQAYHMGFHTLKVQKHATQIHDDLRNITNRFARHFSGVVVLRKKLEEAMKVIDDFGRDARSISRTLENIKNSDSNPDDDDDPDSPTPASTYGQVSEGKH